MTMVTNLQDWVDGEMMRGRYIFTKEEVLALHLPITRNALQNSLNRLTRRGIIMSPWKNFYVAIPIEYKLKGILPPSFYIDRLMRFLGRDYYVSLLSAAALNGATHQSPMVFQVTVDGKPLRSGVKNGTMLEFTLCQNLPLKFTQQVKTQMGYMNVAGAELTAFDIVAEEEKVGGLGRVAELLIELSETISLGDDKLALLNYFSSPTIQRLGYLLDQIENHDLANNLYALMKRSGKRMRLVPLKQSVPFTNDMPKNRHWNIIENYTIEIDEL